MKRNRIGAILFLTIALAAVPGYAFSDSAGCISIRNNLSMNMCVEYQSAPYQFMLSHVPSGSGFTWKMDISTFKPVVNPPDACCYMGDDLAIRLCCATYADYHCAFTLIFVPDPQDPNGLYWKMDASSFAMTPVAIDDPLFPFQWHLCNTGQTAFASYGGRPGEDLRMSRAIAEKLSGLGVIVAVLDSGLEIAHEDISGNVIPGGSYNFVNQTTDPSPTHTTGDHGSSVAGIIAAMSTNGKGGRGVAPQASLKGFNVLESQSAQNYIESMGGHPRSQDVDVFNMSYGDESTGYESLQTTARELYDSTKNLRGGKGGIYVKSAGNGFAYIDLGDDGQDDLYFCSDQIYGRDDLTCQNAVASEENSRPEVILVGAYNAAGNRATYSTAGSNLWISTPGGQYGRNDPAILTIDQSGCEKGYSRTNHPSPVNSFERGDSIYNADCNYTSAFNGTSSAAPNASGAIALLLQANSSLTRRDVKHILAKTARKIDPASSGSIVTVDINGVDYVASEGWVQNSGGYTFHNYYGFGALDVDAAVAMAKTYQAASLPPIQDRLYGEGAFSEPIPIPDNTASGVTRTVQALDDLTIENFFALISIDHPDTGEVGIEITSPQGTKSILLNIRSALKTDMKEDDGVLLASNAFYGEKSKGTWTLRVLDSWEHTEGTLNFFKLQILGY